MLDRCRYLWQNFKKKKKKNPEGDLRTDKSKNGEGRQCESIWEHLHCHRLYLAAVPPLPFSLWEKVNVFSQKQRRFAGSWNVCLHIPSLPAFRNICCNICSAGFLITPALFFFPLFCRSRLSHTVRYSQEKKFAASLGAKLVLLTGLNRLENQEHFVFFFFFMSTNTFGCQASGVAIGAVGLEGFLDLCGYNVLVFLKK